MIILQAELRMALGLNPPISDAETARLMLALDAAHAAVRNYLHYDPEQSLGPAEYYPRGDTLCDYGGYSDGVWDVNRSHSQAFYGEQVGIFGSLQLARLPIREVTDVRVDYSARHGQQNGDFGSGTEWVQGDDYHIEWDEEGVCRSGCLLAVTAWPRTPGTVRVTYRAGYSPDEFQGPPSSSSEAADGTITTQGVDASPIKNACLLTGMASYHEMAAWSKSALTGLLVPGPKQSEDLGSYSYTLASGAAAAMLTSMQLELPPRAAQWLDKYRHMGIMSLG